MFQSCPLSMTLMQSRTATLEMEMDQKGGLSMLCWSGRRNKCEPHELSKDHKHILSILIIIVNSHIILIIHHYNSHIIIYIHVHSLLNYRYYTGTLLISPYI